MKDKIRTLLGYIIIMTCFVIVSLFAFWANSFIEPYVLKCHIPIFVSWFLSSISVCILGIILLDVAARISDFFATKKGGEIMGVFGEMTIPCNSVVGHDYGLVIVKQDDGALFFCEMPEQLIGVGEAMNPSELISISNLPEEQQNELKEKYKHTEV